MGICHGNTKEHCCNLGIAGVCPHLEENTVPGRHWACGLMRKLGDWDAVLASPEYKRDVAPTLEQANINCRDWPAEGQGPCYCGGAE